MIMKDQILRQASAASSIKLGEAFFPSDKILSILKLTKNLECHFELLGQVLHFYYKGQKCHGHLSFCGQEKSLEQLKDDARKEKEKKKTETLLAREVRKLEKEKKIIEKEKKKAETLRAKEVRKIKKIITTKKDIEK